ncbi:hypothetical protein MCNS_21400 [Mycobacterium conspicuum]|uniref:Uncharacterized protein n=1 Tax=Mycobacterium conspicuum TaxID=44010 RepID=A0A7I7YBZ0_9MYCO|nr:hypothetical protein MCNS_21400 [Mycobacterium conspicuum]
MRWVKPGSNLAMSPASPASSVSLSVTRLPNGFAAALDAPQCGVDVFDGNQRARAAG